MSTPEDDLVRAFWKCIRDDIIGRGCTSDNLSPSQRRLPYGDRVILEREQLADSAREYLHTDDFEEWANISHLNHEELRDKFYAISY